MNSQSQLFREEPQQKIRQAAREYLSCELLDARMLSGGLFNTTYRLETEGGRFILRLGPVNRHLLLPYEQHLMAAEGTVLKLLQKHGIPTSEMVALDLSRSLFDRDVMVVACMQARSMSMLELPKDAERRICREAGALTARIHGITAFELPLCPEKPFGRYANVLSGKGCATWKEAVLLELVQWRELAERTNLFSDREIRRIFAVFSGFSSLLDAVTVPRLVHGDLWYGNILVDEHQNLAAIIDADRAFFGDTDFEMATGWMISDSFLEGYGKKPDDSADAVLRRRLYKLLLNLEDCYILFHEYANPQEGAGLKERILDEVAALESNL